MANKFKTRRRRFITIMGVRVKIRYMSKMLFDDEDELHGAFCAETMTIFISTKSDMHATLVHELGHAVLAISGLTHLLSSKTEEAVVSAIENGLKDFFFF